MLERVIWIKNVGRFRNSAASPNPSFTKHTFLFGANAYGKTTFCAVLRSVQSGDVSQMMGRRTLGARENPEIHLLFTEGNRRLQNNAWSETVPHISIFDGAFVSENVHAGDVVDVSHRRNLFRVIVGRAGVALAEQEQTLAEESRAKQTELSAAERRVRALLPHGLDIPVFLHLPADPEIDQKLRAQQQLIEALQQADAIRTRSALMPLDVSLTIDELGTVLARSLEGIAADAEARLQAHLVHHQMRERGEQWISEGMGYIADDECAFCGRGGVAALPIVRAYRDLFSDRYRGFQDEIQNAQQRAVANFGERRQGEVRTQIATNESGLEFWQRYCELGRVAFPNLDDALEKLRRVHEIVSGLLERKRQAPLEPIAEPLELRQAHQLRDEIQPVLDQYNGAIATVNALIAAKKEATAAANLGAARIELARLQTMGRPVPRSGLESVARIQHTLDRLDQATA